MILEKTLRLHLAKTTVGKALGLVALTILATGITIHALRSK
jgi:hypothetical protein